jgi:ankyrin repeat protein
VNAAGQARCALRGVAAAALLTRAQDGASPLIHAVFEGKDALLARLLAPDADPDLRAEWQGQGLAELARSGATRHLVASHPLRKFNDRCVAAHDAYVLPANR